MLAHLSSAAGGAALEPVECAPAGERRMARGRASSRTSATRGVGVTAPPVVVDHLLLGKRDAEDLLPDQRSHAMHHPLRRRR